MLTALLPSSSRTIYHKTYNPKLHFNNVAMLACLFAAQLVLAQNGTFETQAPSNLRSTSVVLRASAPANISLPEVHFEWGTSTSYGHVLPAQRTSVGSALEFDSNTAVTAGVGRFPGITNTFTMELWAKPTIGLTFVEEAANGSIYAQGPQPYAIFPEHGDWSGYGWGHVAVGVAVGTNGVMVVEHSSDLLAPVLVHTGSLSGWTHVAVVYDQGQPTLFIDGVLIRYGLHAERPKHPSANLNAGSSFNYGRYAGSLDEVRIWGAALNGSVLQGWKGSEDLTGHPALSSLATWWHLNEGSGTQVTDASTNGLHGVLTGGAWTTETAPLGQNLSASLNELTPQTTYHYRIVAMQAGIATYGSNVTFTTPEIDKRLPDITTMPASSLSMTTAVLRALAGLPVPPQKVHFEWGTTTNYGQVAPALNGPIGAALSFDGVNDQVITGTGLFPDVTDDFTMEFWAKPLGGLNLAQESAGGSIYYNGAQRWVITPDHGSWVSYPANHVGSGVAVGTNGVMVVEHTDNFMAPVLVHTGSLSGWNHFAVTYNGGVPQLHINGNWVRTGLKSEKTAHPSSNLCGPVGASDYGRFYGDLDEVRVWSKALLAQTVRDWMTNGVSSEHPDYANLLVGWNLDEGIGSTTSDASANGRTGTLENGPLWTTDSPGGSYFAELSGLLRDTTYHYRAVASNEFQVVYGIDQAFTTASGLPAILSQPTNYTAVMGQNASFRVSADGMQPLSYQWTHNGTNIANGTAATLTMSNVQPWQAGLYSVTVTNTFGLITSSNATLTVNLPQPVMRLVGTSAMGGSQLVIPVEIRANGKENTLQFSVNYPHTMLYFAGAAAGTNAGDSILFVVTTQTNVGRLGVMVGLPTDQTYAAGTQQVVLLTFNTGIRSSPATVPLTFGDFPTARQVLDDDSKPIIAQYGNASATILASVLEGDTSPRPNGDRTLAIADWTLLGRYAARLDYPTNALEFQKADCAPRATSGDGQIKVTDWVQAGRYAGVADPATPLGGPTTETSPSAGGSTGDGTERRLMVSSASWFQSQTGAVSIVLAGQGNEAAVGCSLEFDPTRLQFLSASKGTGVGPATFNMNTVQASAGKVGFVVGLSSGTFAAGNCELVKVAFRVLSIQGPGPSVLKLADSPVVREVSYTTALPASTAYEDGLVTLRPFPPISILNRSEGVFVSWPDWATNFQLECTVSLWPANWTNYSGNPFHSNSSFGIIAPGSEPPAFFRLKMP